MWMMPLHLHVNKKSDYDDDDAYLGSNCCLKGVRTSISKETNSNFIFQGGGGGEVPMYPHSGSTHERHPLHFSSLLTFWQGSTVTLIRIVFFWYLAEFGFCFAWL